MTEPAPGHGDPSCAHRVRDAGVCVDCGHCDHELILNRACYFCGTTDLDPIAQSPRRPSLIGPDQLVRRKPT